MNNTASTPLRRRTESPVLPGAPGIWIFILLDMLFFSVLFLAYVAERTNQPGLFATSQEQLNITLGLFNMLVLLTSSWFVALAVHAARRDRREQTLWLLVAAFLCGLIFALVKIAEYFQKFKVGVSMLTNDFFMFYFTLTFIHFLHVIAGMVVLTVMALNARNGAYSARKCTGIETGGTYWHMVDLLWIMLFPLLYMAR